MLFAGLYLISSPGLEVPLPTKDAGTRLLSG
jgi:hypothetical protein